MNLILLSRFLFLLVPFPLPCLRLANGFGLPVLLERRRSSRMKGKRSSRSNMPPGRSRLVSVWMAHAPARARNLHRALRASIWHFCGRSSPFWHLLHAHPRQVLRPRTLASKLPNQASTMMRSRTWFTERRLDSSIHGRQRCRCLCRASGRSNGWERSLDSR
jgi:hypothetical protein